MYYLTRFILSGGHTISIMLLQCHYSTLYFKIVYTIMKILLNWITVVLLIIYS